MGAGHGGRRAVGLPAEVAFKYAFVLDVLGMGNAPRDQGSATATLSSSLRSDDRPCALRLSASTTKLPVGAPRWSRAGALGILAASWTPHSCRVLDQ